MADQPYRRAGEKGEPAADADYDAYWREYYALVDELVARLKADGYAELAAKVREVHDTGYTTGSEFRGAVSQVLRDVKWKTLFGHREVHHCIKRCLAMLRP